MTVGFAASLFAAWHRKPFLIEIQDLWPESVVASGISGAGVFERGLAAMCRYVYRGATHIVAQSHGMAQKLVERGANSDAISVIYNWSNSESPAQRGAATDHETYEFLYTGNIGIYQNLGTVIAAARIAYASEPRIRLTMIGNGAEKARLVENLSTADRAFVRFRDSVPQADLLDIVANADCLLLHLRDMPFFEFTIPSKIPFYLAMAKPVLAGIRGEAAQILRDSGAAEVTAPEAPEAMAVAMIALAHEDMERREGRGRDGAAYYRAHLARDQAIRRTRALFAFPDGIHRL
jgi:glycosyltransferase involved in cell wall biosynthesis